MTTRHTIVKVAAVLAVLLAALLLLAPEAGAQGRDSVARDLKLDQIPRAVLAALEAKFPGASIRQWTREKEGDLLLYDIEVTHGGRAAEADILADGTIQNVERAVSREAVPAAAREAVERRYPKAAWSEIMEIADVESGREVLAGWEIVLRTVEGKEVEVTVAPDGRILEDSSDKPKE